MGEDAGTVVGRVRVPGDTGAGPRRLVSQVGGRALEVVHDAEGTRITLRHSWRTVGAAAGALYGLLVLVVLAITGGGAVAWLAADGDPTAGVACAAFFLFAGGHAVLRAFPACLLPVCGREVVEMRGPRLVVTLVTPLRDRRAAWDVGDGRLTLVGGARSRHAALTENLYVVPIVGRTGGLGLENDDHEMFRRFGAFVGRGAGRRLVEGLRPAAAESK